MHGEWSGGKGSCFRRLNNQKQFSENWDLIFGEKYEDAISESKGKKAPAMDARYTNRGVEYPSRRY